MAANLSVTAADIQMLWVFDPDQPQGITHDWKVAIHAAYKAEIPHYLRDGFAFQRLEVPDSGIMDQAEVGRLLTEELRKVNEARQELDAGAPLFALAANKPAKVIGQSALLKDRPGFEVDFLTRGSAPGEQTTAEKPTVLMPVRGHWHLSMDGYKTILAPGDTALLLPGEAHVIAPSMTGEASLYRVTATDDPAGATWTG